MDCQNSCSCIGMAFEVYKRCMVAGLNIDTTSEIINNFTKYAPDMSISDISNESREAIKKLVTQYGLLDFPVPHKIHEKYKYDLLPNRKVNNFGWWLKSEYCTAESWKESPLYFNSSMYRFGDYSGLYRDTPSQYLV